MGVFALAVYACVQSAPCWTDYKQCGSAPLCGTGEPGSGASYDVCIHRYCDDGQTCPNPATRKRMMTSTRDKWEWWNGSAFQVCVGAADTATTDFCCLCNQPGTEWVIEPF